MTRDEVKKLLMSLEMIYSNFKVENPKEMTDVWHMILKDYDYAETNKAILTFVKTSNSAFAPSVSQIIALLPRKELGEVEAWRQVRKAIRDGIYHSEERFAELSPEVKKAVGEAGQLRDWALLESEVIDSVIQSNFFKTYKTIVVREREQAALGVNNTKAIGEK